MISIIKLIGIIGMIIISLLLWVRKENRKENRIQENSVRNGFKILVPRKKRGEEFKFTDLMKEAEVFHGRCYNGKAELKQEKGECAPYWRLICWRCQLTEIFGTPGSFDGSDEIIAAKGKVVKTAIDGGTRTLGTTIPGTLLYVVPKTQKNNSLS